MKKVLFIILITISIFSFGQGYYDYTLDYFVSSSKEMKFNLKMEKTDSIVLTKGFNFNEFKPSNYNQKDGFFKTYYRKNKIDLVEYFSDTLMEKIEYHCIVNDFDSLKYFIFKRPINPDTSIINHSIGVNINKAKLSLIFATHRWYYTDTLILNDSNFAINYPAPEQYEKETKYEFDTNYKISWVLDSYESGRSVLIVDSNLFPQNRLYFFNGDFLLYFTKCEVFGDKCAEYIFSYNPILQYYNYKFLLNTIDVKLLLRIKQIDMLSTFVIKTFYPIENYYFKWEYYKFFIGKNWKEYK